MSTPSSTRPGTLPEAGPGSWMGRFRLVERVGPTTWQAREQVDGVERAVAVRLFAPDAALRARLRRAVVLAHAHVVEVRDVGEASGHLYVARQWVAGCDVGRLAATGVRMPLRCHVLVALDVLRGLEHAAKLVDVDGQAVGLAHGRVSASNVLVSFEGEVRLTDFAVAADASWAQDGAAVAELLARAPTVPQGLAAIMARARQGGYAGPTALREDLEGWARREGLLLSPAELGQLARDVISGASSPKATTLPPVARKAVAIQPFDQALGMGLAALHRGDAEDDADSAQTVSAPLVSRSPRTVGVQPIVARVGTDPALPAPIVPTRPAAQPTPAPSPRVERPTTPARPAARAPVDEIPRHSRAPLLLLGGGALVAFVAVGAWAHVSHPPAPSLLAPPPGVPVAPTAPSQPAVAAAPVTIPTFMPATHATHAAPTAPARPKPPRPARLSITSDVPCDAMVDGRFVGPTPVRDLVLPAGKHVVRLESTMSGLRLIPREQTVELSAGESKPLTMVMQ